MIDKCEKKNIKENEMIIKSRCDLKALDNNWRLITFNYIVISYLRFISTMTFKIWMKSSVYPIFGDNRK